ncbi:MAG: hypothetical protein HYW51_01430 [Candidatus Doudnabacteria bacterium]|nr:hypothetical protein [Candidatus Doudnabacteria bacterium]
MLENFGLSNLVVHGLIFAIMIGGLYNLWHTTKLYGGLIGKAIRLLGIGMLFIVVAVIQEFLLKFGVLNDTTLLALGQDLVTLIGLFFLAIGFSKLASVNKTP